MKTFPAACRALALIVLATTTGLAADGGDDDAPITTGLNGHLKVRFDLLDFPQDSAFREFLGSTASDAGVEGRLNFSARGTRWDFEAAYQFFMLYSDTLVLTRELPGVAAPVDRVISDDRRWWNLTTRFGDGKTAVINRLDRLNIGFTTEKTVWRFGRQAITWGNGLVFSPMDVFNPFDPAAVDTEYKTGDDMLYGQVLFDSGDDLQAVGVVRRDALTGDVEKDQSSLAFKYHGFIGMEEYDLLAAEHYDDRILGVGGITAVGGAIWRGDLTWTRTDIESVFSLATSLSYSWTWGGKSISGLVEYYHNGFGQKGGRYSPRELAGNPDLLARISRGELFTLGRNYLAFSARVEVTPLLQVTPNLFLNLDDPSALAQLVVNYSWKQDVQVLAALNVPIGQDGSEYGGIPGTAEGEYLSTGFSLMSQLAWYF